MVDGPGRTRPPLARLGGSAGLPPISAGGTTAASEEGDNGTIFHKPLPDALLRQDPEIVFSVL